MKTRDAKRIFKDWIMPGPEAAEAPTQKEIPPPDPVAGKVTLDALSGLWRIYQYERGHRYSTDDVLTAWFGTTKCPSARRVLDLGSGIGSVGMMAAWRLQGSQFVTIEAQDISVKLARLSARYNGIEHRYKIIKGDLRDEALLAAEEDFDLILGSPPYFPLGTGIEGEHPQTIPCRFEVRGDISHYAITAARKLAAGGVFAFVFPTEQLERAETGAKKAGFSILTRRDIVFREGNAPLISLFACALESDLSLSIRGKSWIEPPLIVRTPQGDVHPEYRVVKFTMGFRP